MTVPKISLSLPVLTITLLPVVVSMSLSISSSAAFLMLCVELYFTPFSLYLWCLFPAYLSVKIMLMSALEIGPFCSWSPLLLNILLAFEHLNFLVFRGRCLHSMIHCLVLSVMIMNIWVHSLAANLLLNNHSCSASHLKTQKWKFSDLFRCGKKTFVRYAMQKISRPVSGLGVALTILSLHVSLCSYPVVPHLPLLCKKWLTEVPRPSEICLFDTIDRVLSTSVALGLMLHFCMLGFFLMCFRLMVRALSSFVLLIDVC